MSKKVKRAGKHKTAPKKSRAKRTIKKAKSSYTHRTEETISKRVVSTKGKEESQHAKAERAYRKYGNGILDKLGPHGVIGLSIGPRFKNGVPTKEMTIRLHVATEEGKRNLKKNAKEIGFQKTYGGVGTDIVVWDFQTAASNDLDGKSIVGEHPGTLGTKVIVEIDGKSTARWITAAHVVTSQPELPASHVRITTGDGKEIGTVSKDELFRNKFVDVAFIKPKRSIPIKPRARRFEALKDTDKNAVVTMKGAVTPPGIKGKIVDLNYIGTITAPPPIGLEEVVGHFLVEGENQQAFCAGGDSGGIVFKDRVLVGVIRAVRTDGAAIVTQLDVIADQTMEFKL